jgi:hypothetical protein
MSKVYHFVTTYMQRFRNHLHKGLSRTFIPHEPKPRNASNVKASVKIKHKPLHWLPQTSDFHHLVAELSARQCVVGVELEGLR